MNIQELIDRLNLLGLDPAESSVYVHLSMLGPSKASDVATAAKIRRTEAYRILQALIQRGFATATLSRPQRFEAAPPEQLFRELHAAQRARQENLARTESEISTILTSLRGKQEAETGAGRSAFRILQGRREIHTVLERMIRDADHSIRAITTHEAGLSMADAAGLWDAAMEKAREGVEVEGLILTAPTLPAKLKALGEMPTLQMRAIATKRMIRFAVVDEADLLLWVTSDPSSRLTSAEDVALWTQAPDFVGLQLALFEALWADAKPIAPDP